MESQQGSSPGLNQLHKELEADLKTKHEESAKAGPKCRPVRARTA